MEPKRETPDAAPSMRTVRVRAATRADAPELCALLNEIIRIGGTTGHETPLNEASFAAHFLEGPGFICCFAAEGANGALLGFQAMERHPKLPEGWADIGTFARAEPKIPGVGTALFAVTRAFAAEQGLAAINATIRADNTGGLAYYAKMGFVDHAVQEAVPLQDGTPVDRISKMYTLAGLPSEGERRWNSVHFRSASR